MCSDWPADRECIVNGRMACGQVLAEN